MRLMGIDMGTSGCKAVIFDAEWQVVYSAYREYGMHFPGEGLLELDAETVWDGIKEVVVEANAKCDKPVSAVAISAIGDVVIPCRSDGTPVRRSIVDFDPRGGDELNRFVQHFGKRDFFHTTGMPPLYIGSLAKILWLKHHEPEVFNKAERWATFEDFIVQKLGLEPQVSYSEAARTMLFNIRDKRWDKEILELIPLQPSALPKPVQAATRLGRIDDKRGRELGFGPGVEVVSGGHDMVCAAVGAGLDEADPSTAVDIAGTIEGIVAAMAEPNTGAEMLKNSFPCYPSHKGYVTFSVNLTAGCIVRWLRDQIVAEEARECAQEGIDFYEHMQRAVDSARPGGMLFLPHFSGSGNPHFDPLARGALYGLTLDTRREDIARALIEGLSYELRLHVESFRRAGMGIDAIRAVGGGARIDKQLQLKANVTGLRVIKGAAVEAAALGAAAYAGTALGMIGNPAQPFHSIKTQEKTFLPDQEACRRFDKAYRQYERFSQAIHAFEKGTNA